MRGGSTTKSLRIALVACTSSLQPPNAEPLAIETLAAALTRQFGDAVIVEMIPIGHQADPGAVELASRLAERGEFDIVGLSIPQGTLHVARQLLGHLADKQAQDEVRPLLVLGHALPTNLPELFLREFPDALVVRGWGEAALLGIVQQCLSRGLDWSEVPSLAYVRQGTIVRTAVEWIVPPTPLRLDPLGYLQRVESSRGCQYGECTFCTREPMCTSGPRWVRLPLHQVELQIRELKQRGVQHFTFTDEDFIGDDFAGAEQLAHAVGLIGGLAFSLSVRADDIWSPRDSANEAVRRRRLLELLRAGGLSLVFLGIESLSDSQLARYGKGIGVRGNTNAASLLRELGVPTEVGFILFDPLVSLEELHENTLQLERTGLWRSVGQLFNCLRLQSNTSIAEAATRAGVVKDLDPNTMQYPYSFADPIVDRIAALCIRWKEEIDDVYLLARSIHRTCVGESPHSEFVMGMRELQFDLLKSVLGNAAAGEALDIDVGFHRRRHALVSTLMEALAKSPAPTQTADAILVAAERSLGRPDAV